MAALSRAQRALVEAYREGLGQRAAARLSAGELHNGALTAIARVEDELARMQAAGALKAVNASYRQYRLQAAGRGERVVPYAAWMLRYKANLVREVAANLR